MLNGGLLILIIFEKLRIINVIEINVKIIIE